MKRITTESVMKKAHAAFESSGISLDELGRRMGHDKNPRQSAWQFLNNTSDPRLSMLIRFAEALHIDLNEILK